VRVAADPIGDLRRPGPWAGENLVVPSERTHHRPDSASAGSVGRATRKRPRGSYVRFERSGPMQLWQRDIVGGIRLVNATTGELREAKVVTAAAQWPADRETTLDLVCHAEQHQSYTLISDEAALRVLWLPGVAAMTLATANIKPGDLLLFHGKGFVSWAIRKIDGSEVNHVAIAFGDGLAEAGGALQTRPIPTSFTKDDTASLNESSTESTSGKRQALHEAEDFCCDSVARRTLDWKGNLLSHSNRSDFV
jgi:hypothetical protein